MLRNTSRIANILKPIIARRPAITPPTPIAPIKHSSSTVRSFASTSKTNDLMFGFFNLSNPVHVKAAGAILDREMAHQDEQNKHLARTYYLMVDWLRLYVNSQELIDHYENRRFLELAAEATYWSVQFGLPDFIKKMTYAEIREFKPLEKCVFDNDLFSKVINKICGELKKPIESREASYALKQAAYCIYVHENSFEKAKEAEQLYKRITTILPSLR